MEPLEVWAEMQKAYQQYCYWYNRHPRTLDYLSECCACDKGMKEAKAKMAELIAKL
jgi:hypothetical protein